VRDVVALRWIKLAHTVAWAFFAGCILLVPVFGWLERYSAAGVLSLIVMLEVLVLAANGWSCPLTAVAASYTDDRRDNFDIYLPLWLARHNKVVFGTLFVAGLAFVLLRVLA
jgi:hypothetical protein